MSSCFFNDAWFALISPFERLLATRHWSAGTLVPHTQRDPGPFLRRGTPFSSERDVILIISLDHNLFPDNRSSDELVHGRCDTHLLAPADQVAVYVLHFSHLPLAHVDQHARQVVLGRETGLYDC